MAGFEQCVEACTRTGAWDEAVEWAERAVRVADTVGSSYHGAKLRHLLGAALVVQANRTGTGIRVGRLRRLAAEAKELQARAKPWQVSAAAALGFQPKPACNFSRAQTPIAPCRPLQPAHFYKGITSVPLKASLQ